MQQNHQWKIQTAFSDGADLKTVVLPIGVLPLLRIGQKYKKGEAQTTNKFGNFNQVKITKLGLGKKSKALDVCRKFNYYLYKDPNLMNQNMWSFTEGRYTYHIPGNLRLNTSLSSFLE